MELNLTHEADQSTIFSRNSEVTKLIELCIMPKTKKEMEAILLDFWDKYEEYMPASEDLSEFDVACMYVLDYVYKHKDVPLSSVPRTIYSYLKPIDLSYLENNGNEFFESGNGCFWTAARQITSFHSLQGEMILVKALFNCTMSGNFGLIKFLLKFGLEQFVFKASGTGEKFLGQLAHWFHNIHASGHIGEEADQRTIQIDDLINRIKEGEITFRRSMLIFCNICIIAKNFALGVEVNEVAGQGHLVEFWKEFRKKFCESTLKCLDIIINATTEPKITIKEIDNFLAFLNPLIGENVVRFLMETSRKIYPEVHMLYQPRSLKDLARCEIRASLRNSSTMPQQVHQLEIPATLKDFLLFDTKDIWGYLKEVEQLVNARESLRNFSDCVRMFKYMEN